MWSVTSRIVTLSKSVTAWLSSTYVAGLGGRTDDVGHWLCEISHDKAAISALIPLSQKVYTFSVYPLTIATPNLQPRILHDPDPIGIVLGYRLTGGGARFFPTLWQGTVVALITRLPTYCRFHGLAVAKFVRRHHPPCDSVGSLRRSCRNNSQSHHLITTIDMRCLFRSTTITILGLFFSVISGRWVAWLFAISIQPILR